MPTSLSIWFLSWGCAIVVLDQLGFAFHASPGKITAVVLGIMIAIVCAALWIFCARRRQRKLERDAALLGSTRHLGPQEGEVFDGDQPEYVNSSLGSGGPPIMEERYGGILAALHTGSHAGARKGFMDRDENVRRTKTATQVSAIFAYASA